jgi:hypothetical protein
MASLGNLIVRVGADLNGLRSSKTAAGKMFTSISTAGKRAMLGIATATAAASAALVVLTARSLATVDGQTKLAASLTTSTKSIQVMSRASELAGVNVSGLEQASKDLQRRLSQAAAGIGPAGDALDHLNLSAETLLNMPLDQRIDTINNAIKEFVPAAEQAAVAGLLFGEEGSLAMSRIDSATIRQATTDIEDLGVAMSEFEAAGIEEANDAISRMKLVFEGFANQIAARVAPHLTLMADKFTEMSTAGTPLYGKVQKLVDAFERLAETLTSEDAINAAVAGFETLMVLAENAAKAMVLLANNSELAIGVVSALALVMMGLAGPFGVIALGVGAAAALYVAMEKNQKPADDFAVAAEAAKDAVVLLNGSLDTFSSAASPSAQGAALSNAEAYKQQALAALEAARAALVEKQARQDLSNSLLDQNPLTAGGNSGYAEAISAEVSAAEQEVLAIEAQIEEATLRIKSMVTGLTGGSMMVDTPSAGPGTDNQTPFATDDDEPEAAPGVGGASEIEEAFQERLAALQEGFATEQESIDEWRVQAEEDLAAARERGLISEQEYQDGLAQIEIDHMSEMSQLRAKASAEEISMRKQTFSALASLMGQFGSKNKAFAKAAVALNAAQRVSEISANTAAAATRALAELGPVAGPPAAARISAYGTVQKGIALASAAMSMGSAGGSGSGSIDTDTDSSSSSSSSSSSGSSQTLNFHIVDDPFGISSSLIKSLMTAMNEQSMNGNQLIATVSPS